jgi:hypothetical protein
MRINEFKQKNFSKLSEKQSGMFIPDPDFIHPGSRGQKAKIPDPDPQHWIFGWPLTLMNILRFVYTNQFGFPFRFWMLWPT